MLEHWGSTIYWNTMSWEALVALLAVVAAGFVGWRQVGVVKEQATLQQLALRHGLFERRHAVYRAVSAWLGFISMGSTVPNRPVGVVLSPEQADAQSSMEKEFLEALDMSRFVFRASVFSDLNELWEAANTLHYHHASVRRAVGSEAEMHRLKVAEISASLREAYQGLAAIFGDELRLDDGGVVNTAPIAAADEIASSLAAAAVEAFARAAVGPVVR